MPRQLHADGGTRPCEWLLGESVEAFEAFGEFTATVFEPRVGIQYRFELQADGPMSAIASLRNDTSDLQHFDVLGHCSERDRKQRSQLADGHFTSCSEVFHDRATDRVTQRSQRLGHNVNGGCRARAHEVGS